MINLLDNDLYKVTMMYAVYKKYQNIKVKYKFFFRNRDKFNISKEAFGLLIGNIINKIYETTYINEKDVEFLKNLKWLDEGFLNFLKNFNLNDYDIEFNVDNNNYSFTYSGTWLSTILLEVVLLSQISEQIQLNLDLNIEKDVHDFYMNKLKQKGIKFVDFGTRRRYSKEFHEYIIDRYRDVLIGTSNIEMARKFNLKPIGTMAHEWLMAHQVLSPLKYFEKEALKTWADVYNGDLGIALTDTISLQYFLSNSFDKYLAKLYDGVRLDTECNEGSIKYVVDFYKNMGIDPITKHIILSDGLKFNQLEDFENIKKKYNINLSYGIGTSFTNPFGKPSDIVIKLIEVENMPVIKISNNPHKMICEDDNFKNFMLRRFFHGEN